MNESIVTDDIKSALMICLLSGWELPASNIGHISLQCFADGGAALEEILHELRMLPRRDGEDVVDDQQLPIAFDASTETDHRDFEFAGDFLCQGGGDAFQQ